MANTKPNKEYNRFKLKHYRFEFMTAGRAPADRMKKAILARCEEETNGFIAGPISASHKGRVSGEISYRLPSGAATPTHIKKLIKGLAKKRDVPIDVADIEIEFLSGEEPTK